MQRAAAAGAAVHHSVVGILAIAEERSRIARMIPRRPQPNLASALGEVPAVALLGPRQVRIRHMIDLLLELPGHRQPCAIEIKRGLAPKIERGFHLACESVQPERRLVVYGGVERFPLADGVQAVALGDL